ncbi:MAG: hypothetical protein ABIK99_04995 [candidate division WOR-3 bacterium]
MTKREVLEKLEEFLKSNRPEISLIFDEIEGEGGLCSLKGKYYIIVNRRLSLDAKIKIITAALKQLNSFELPPEIKEVIKKWAE